MPITQWPVFASGCVGIINDSQRVCVFFMHTHAHMHVLFFFSAFAWLGNTNSSQIVGKEKKNQFILYCLFHKNTQVWSRYCSSVIAKKMKIKVNDGPFQNSHKWTFIAIIASSSFTQCARTVNFSGTILGGGQWGGAVYSASSRPEDSDSWTGCVQDVAGHAGFHLPPTSLRSRVTVTVILTLCELRDEKNT